MALLLSSLKSNCKRDNDTDLKRKYVMQLFIYKVLLLLSGLLLAPQVPGQIEITELDSITIVKPKKNKDLYKFIDNGLKEIQFQDFSPVLAKDPSTPKLNGFGSSAFTLLTGIGSSSRTDGYWKVSGSVLCNDMLPGWNVNLFCEGYREKYRERVKDNEGSSIETNETIYYNWENGAHGVIIESIDTIGSFKIVMSVNSDELLSKWFVYIFQEKPHEQNISSKNNWLSTSDLSAGKSYEINGKFRDRISS